MRKLIKLFASAPVAILLALYRAGWFDFTTIARLLAVVPGFGGVWWRRWWYERTLAHCGVDLYVDWMGALKTPKASVGDRVFIGTFCWIGWADIGSDVMLGGHITVLSGARHHAFDRLEIPMARQPVTLGKVTIGDDVWVGNGSIIMADVAAGSVIGAGAVVNRTFEPYSVLAGVPARMVRRRTPASQSPGA